MAFSGTVEQVDTETAITLIGSQEWEHVAASVLFFLDQSMKDLARIEEHVCACPAGAKLLNDTRQAIVHGVFYLGAKVGSSEVIEVARDAMDGYRAREIELAQAEASGSDKH